MSFLGTAMLILVIAVVVLAILAVALFIIHKRLKKKVVVKEQIEQKENIIKNKLENLRHSNIVPQESLKSLDELAKSFLKETFKIEKNLDYSEMIKLFEEKKKKNIAFFCNQMLRALYSGEKIEKNKINLLISGLEEIIREQYPNMAKTRIEIKPSPPQQPARQIKEKIPIKVEEKPFEFPKEEEKITLPLVIMPQREKMMRQINSLDEEQIRDAYAELQKEFTQAYEIAEITKNEKIRGELEKFRESMKKRVDDYAKYNKIIEFAQEISKGAKLISLLSFS